MVCSRNELPPLRSSLPGIRRIVKRGIQREFTNMQPERQATAMSWTGLSGNILSGGYELKELLTADGDTAQFRVRVLGDRSLDAVARFIRVSREETERQAAIWELMRELRHPNLMRPLGAGSWKHENDELAYIVVNRADEALQRTLAERPLTPAETTEFLLSVTKALEVLHLHGLAHGCLSPEQILAFGPTIQLPVACVRQAGRKPEVSLIAPKYLAPESRAGEGEGGENVTAEADIWCLGATIFEALTRKEWSEESREETSALPEPFATIALRCLEADPGKRCRLPEAVSLLKGEIKPAPRAKAAAAAAGSSISAANGSAVGLALQTPAIPLTVPAAALASEGVSSPLEGAVKAPEQNQTSVVAQNLAPTPAPREVQPDLKPTAVAPSAIPPAQGTGQPSSNQSVRPAQPVRSTSQPVPAPAVSKPSTPKGTQSAGPRPQAASVAAKPSATAGQKSNTVRTGVSQLPPKPRVAKAAPAASSGISKQWIGVGAAFLFLVVLIWALRPRPETTPAAIKRTAPAAAAKRPVVPSPTPQTNNGVAASESTKAPVLPSSETKLLRPDGTAAQPETSYPEMPAAKRTVPKASAPVAASAGDARQPVVGASVNGDVWHVILYTYSRAEAASRMAETINKRHPDLHAEVFSPKMDQGPYLVTAGGGMSKEEAAQMRRTAVRNGMPRDTYVQNFKR